MNSSVTTFSFAGDLDIIWVAGIAIGLSILSWWLYRLETKREASPPLDKLLPILRALAVALIVMILAGPTLSKISREGELGKVFVFLDGSESMSIRDKHMSPGRKLLLAEKHGWLPKDQNLLDPTLHDAADLLADARTEIDQRLQETEPDLNDLRLDFIRKVDRAAGMLAQKRYELPPSSEKPSVLKHELWLDLQGSAIRDLTGNDKFKSEEPDFIGYLKSAESPMNAGDNYGRKISALIIPPEDGEYVFWIYADDECVLRLNPVGQRTEGAREILKSPDYTQAVWQENRRSKPIPLQANQRYYFEILHKEGSGDDFCAVGWTLPSGRMERPIPGRRFVSPAGGRQESFDDLRSRIEADLIQSAKALQAPRDEEMKTDFAGSLKSLSETARIHEIRLRRTFDYYAERQARSDSVGIRDAILAFDQSARWQRAVRLLNKRDSGILKQLEKTHLLEVRSLSDFDSRRLWDNSDQSSPPNDFGDCPETRRTDLASSVHAVTKNRTGNYQKDGQNPPSAAVILSDGFHNSGASPLEAAKLLASRDIPIHTIGLGSELSPPDLAVLIVEHPAKVLKDDRLRGSIIIKDELRPGTPFKVSIEDENGSVVWEEKLIGNKQSRRKVDFDFSIESMVEERMSELGLDRSVVVNALPFRMKARAHPVEGEAREDNNERSIRFDAITKRNRLLIIDGRPRWETRYLRNLFQRDERWEVSLAVAGPGASADSLPRGAGTDAFPEDRRTLFAFDLLVLGEISLELFKPEELEWIRDFVASRGGGLILIDGPRQKFRNYAKDQEHPISSLLPVKWVEGSPERLAPHSMALTERGLATQALFLHPKAERNAELWSYLPLPGWVSPSQALPGTEVFLEAKLDAKGEDKVPLLVARQAGAGKVLYAGFDGTWRWRLEVADEYHLRYWNQVASWIMEQPFAVRDDFVSIDPGSSSYRPGESAEMRIRVRNREGKPLQDQDALVEALVWRGDKVIATVPMKLEPQSGGLFLGETPALLSGRHEVTVRVDGVFQPEELLSRAEFLVEEPDSPELQNLTCNEEMLRKMSEFSGGTYLREEQIDRLNALLRPVSSGRLVKNEIALWQSYWWFVPIILLLGLELFLRKRAGML